jgi:hypothetical protein
VCNECSSLCIFTVAKKGAVRFKASDCVIRGEEAEKRGHAPFGENSKVRGVFTRTTLGLISWGRCYDHNFLRFSPILGEQIGVFQKNQCNGPIFLQKLAVF